MAKKKAKAGPKGDSGLKIIAGDFLVTALYVVASSLLGELAEWLILTFPQLRDVKGISRDQLEYGLNIVLLLVLIYLFAPICQIAGGAIVNPTSVLSIVTAGRGKLHLNVLRMVSETAGAFAGSYATTQLVPSAYHSKFQSLPGGLKEDVQVAYGFACEAGLGCAMNLLFLYSLDTHNKQLGFWVPLLATAVWCYVGSYFTGPSMNPSISASWNLHYQVHSPQEHLVVFWAGPFVGAAVAGLLYKQLNAALQPAAPTKKKRAVQKQPAAAVHPAVAEEQEAVHAAAPAAPAAAAASEGRTARARNKKATNGVLASAPKPAIHGSHGWDGTSAGDDAAAGMAAATLQPAAPAAGAAGAQQEASKARRRKKKAAADVVEDGWQKVGPRR